jgi:hypothetical protein
LKGAFWTMWCRTGSDLGSFWFRGGFRLVCAGAPETKQKPKRNHARAGAKANHPEGASKDADCHLLRPQHCQGLCDASSCDIDPIARALGPAATTLIKWGRGAKRNRDGTLDNNPPTWVSAMSKHRCEGRGGGGEFLVGAIPCSRFAVHRRPGEPETNVRLLYSGCPQHRFR